MNSGHDIHIENINISIEEFNLLKKEKVELSAKVSDLTVELLYYKHEQVLRGEIYPTQVCPSRRRGYYHWRTSIVSDTQGECRAGFVVTYTGKFTDHLPFYRQVQQFKRQDITIAKSALNGWFSATCDLLEPLYDKFMQKVRQSWYLMGDETPLPVLTSLNEYFGQSVQLIRSKVYNSIWDRFAL